MIKCVICSRKDTVYCWIYIKDSYILYITLHYINCNSIYIHQSFMDKRITSPFINMMCLYMIIFIYLFIYFNLFIRQGRCTLIDIPVNAPELANRLFFICSPWTDVESHPKNKIHFKWQVNTISKTTFNIDAYIMIKAYIKT